MSAEDHIQAIDQAQRELDRTIEGIDAGTVVTEAAADLQAAAFGLEQAHLALFLDAGCLTGDTTATKAVRDYTVVRPWLWAQEKRALDGANAELLAYDRLSLYMPARPAALWLPGFLLRIAIWGGLPALGVLVWLIRRLWPG